MKPLERLAHIGGTLLALFLLAALPILTNFPVFTLPGVDAVSSASIELPAQPSGDFVILLNTGLHRDTLEDWRSFFLDEDFAVIFEDIHCMVAEGDAAGLQLAERFQAQLPEHQMSLRTENPTLLVSKAEAGYIDVAVFSREMAEALQLAPAEALHGMAVIQVTGGER